MYNNAYNINDLLKATYCYVDIQKSGVFGRIKTSGIRRGVLYKVDEDYYMDLIANKPVLKDNIVGEAEPFIAKDTVVSRANVIAIFNYLENEFPYQKVDDVTVEFTNVFSEAACKIKTIGSLTKK